MWTFSSILCIYYVRYIFRLNVRFLWFSGKKVYNERFVKGKPWKSARLYRFSINLTVFSLGCDTCVKDLYLISHWIRKKINTSSHAYRILNNRNTQQHLQISFFISTLAVCDYHWDSCVYLISFDYICSNKKMLLIMACPHRDSKSYNE